MRALATDHGAWTRSWIRTIWTVVLLAPLLVASPAGAGAQSGERGGAELTREEMLERLHAGFERKMETRIGLDSETRAEVREILDSMRSERRAIYHRKRELARQREAFGEEGGSQARARGILAEARAIRAEEARIEAEEEARLLELLSPRQVLEFQILREEFSERIRRVYRGEDGRSSRQDGSSP